MVNKINKNNKKLHLDNGIRKTWIYLVILAVLVNKKLMELLNWSQLSSEFSNLDRNYHHNSLEKGIQNNKTTLIYKNEFLSIVNLVKTIKEQELIFYPENFYINDSEHSIGMNTEGIIIYDSS